ncbi:MAG: hypothetical protein V4596_10685 [Bdellovibrionota bacterium]
MEKYIALNALNTFKEKALENWKLVILVLVGAIFANLYYVKENIISNQIFSGIYPSQAPVFRTYKTTGNTFYQKKDSRKWLFLSGEEILSNGSEIQTDADSHAILSFVGQSGRVELSEKTHVGVIKNGNDTTIDFKKGEIYINYQAGSAQKPLFVKIDQKVFKMTNSDLYISGDLEDQVQVSVEYGKTTMALGQQVSTLEKGQSVFFRSDRDYTVEDSKFKIKNPFNYDRYNLEKNEYRVRFAFEPFSENYQVQLMVGSSLETMTPHFAQPQTFPPNLPEVEFGIPFKKGSYYWQLVAFEGAKPIFLSHVKRFFVEPQSAIQLVKPLVNSKFQLIDGKADVQFQWDNPSQLEKAFIEISDRRDFSKTLVHESIPENNYFNQEFREVGDYYWRVSGFPFGTSDLVASAVGKLSIVNDVVPQQVRVIFPKGKTVLTTLSLKNSDITFQWTKNSATSVYQVEIKSLKDNKIFEFTTEDTQIKVKDLNPGKYSWKVSDKKSNLVSTTEEFSVVHTKRLNFLSNLSKGSEEFGFLSWQQGPKGTVQYRVEVLRIGSRSDFNAFFDEKSSTKRSLEIKGDRISYKNFSDGIYAFKVYALDSEKNILADSNLKFLKVGNPKK